MLLQAVQLSGYPLQSDVARELSKQFQVVEEWGFADRTTKEHRTLGVYAFRELDDPVGQLRPRLHLLVECKRSDLPFVFFPPGVGRVPWDFPEILGVGNFSLDLGNRTTQDACPATFFCAKDSPFVSLPQLAVSFTRAHRKNKDLELSGDVPFNQVVMPLVGALEQARRIFGGINGTPLIVLGLCAVDAAMVVADGPADSPVLKLEPWVRVVHQENAEEGHQWRRRNYAIDFVHREFLEKYIVEHALPSPTRSPPA